MFGFMKGKIEIQIPRSNYAYGELIEGKVSMELKQPLKAKGVFIQLLAEQKVDEHRGGKTTTHTHTIHSQTLPLDIEKEYPAGQRIEYPFQLTVPSFQGPQIDMGGNLGKVINVMQAASPFIEAFGLGHSHPVEWFLKVKLDVSGFDVNKDVRLQISNFKT
jgi:hypothetical protein